jgi:CRP-like cAMP-binding protein
LQQGSTLTPLLARWQQRVSFTDEEQKAVLSLPFTRRQMHRDAYLVREGETPTHCHLLLAGFAYRQKLITTGARQIISIHIMGEFVDLQNLLLATADHNVQSLGRSEVAMVPVPALSELIGRYPAIRRAVWLDSLIDSSIFREWVVNVGRRSARARVAHLLCELSLRMRRSGLSQGDSFHLPLTQEQMADATGLTAVHTNRTLQGLRRDGIISFSSGTMTLLDWDRLAEAGDFSERYLHHDE